MIQDNDQITGVIKITVSLDGMQKATLDLPAEETFLVAAKGETLGDIGTVVQREVYEALRRVAEKHLLRTQPAAQVSHKPT